MSRIKLLLDLVEDIRAVADDLQAIADEMVSGHAQKNADDMTGDETVE